MSKQVECHGQRPSGDAGKKVTNDSFGLLEELQMRAKLRALAAAVASARSTVRAGRIALASSVGRGRGDLSVRSKAVPGWLI
jgi:hypothetical protein